MTMLSVQRSASDDGRRRAPSVIGRCVVLFGHLLGMALRCAHRRQTNKRRGGPDVNGAYQYALARLHDLPSTLHYHALRHTLDDVLPAVERFAALSGVTGHARDLLRTAAMFHDIGYIHTRSDHEAASIALCRDVLPTFGFSGDDVTQIVGMIEATKLPQNPRTPLEAILADADLDSLGRLDFFARSDELRAECAACGNATDRRAWYGQQCRFLEEHTYHTSAARALRDAQKARNIAQLRAIARRPRPDGTRPH